MLTQLVEYHIHVNQVPEDGDCAETLGHLDPYNRGITPPCDAEAPETCQLGDLSGKHGEISGGPESPFQDSYTDDYLSTRTGEAAFFGNLSVVVHSANDTRLSCGNFYLVSGATPTPSAAASTEKATNATASSATATSTFPVFTGAAIPARRLSMNAILLALGVFLF
jgi:hypothetical protein